MTITLGVLSPIRCSSATPPCLVFLSGCVGCDWSELVGQSRTHQVDDRSHWAI